jgi:hypothetical protein
MFYVPRVPCFCGLLYESSGTYLVLWQSGCHTMRPVSHFYFEGYYLLSIEITRNNINTLLLPCLLLAAC